MSIIYPPPCANCAYEGEAADLHNLIQVQTDRIVQLERELAEALALLQMNDEYRIRASALLKDQEDLITRVINMLPDHEELLPNYVKYLQERLESWNIHFSGFTQWKTRQ